MISQWLQLMWLWMPFLHCKPHATLAESSLSTLSPDLLCSGVPKWDRTSLPKDLCTLPTTADISQQLLHPTLVPFWAYCPSDPWHQVVTVANKTFFPSLLAFLKNLQYLCMWWGNSHLLKILLVLLLPVPGFPSQCCNFPICCGRIVLAAHLHY